ncbi:MAG: ferredoxin--NADP reductase [Planctomycetes bacterium]|nr:ferredoxin--NADP reductase [Planctomycetota bacterium]
MKTELNAIVTHRVEVASGLIILRVAPDGWELPKWSAGQFAVLGLPYGAPRIHIADKESGEVDSEKMIRRAYSIASGSGEKTYLEFYITLVHSGALTPRLFELRPGNQVHLGKKITGMFTLDKVPAECDLTLVGTGTGLAPYMSMLRSELEIRPDRHIVVLQGARHSWDLGYRGELTALQRVCPTFHYVPIISRPKLELVPWGGETGYVQDLVERGRLESFLGRKPTPENMHFLLCGNPGMINGMIERLAMDKFTEHSKKNPGQIHAEKYW